MKKKLSAALMAGVLMFSMAACSGGPAATPHRPPGIQPRVPRCRGVRAKAVKASIKIP